MFNAKSNASAQQTSGGNTTIIGAGTVITGNIESDGDIRIDGTLKGNLKAKAKIIIGADGFIEGNLAGEQADILGKVNGILKINDLLQLRGAANIKGDIYAGKLQIEPSVNFNGQCHMGASVVELNAAAEISNAINQ